MSECPKLEEWLTELEPGAELPEELDEHLEQCADCAAKLARLQLIEQLENALDMLRSA